MRDSKSSDAARQQGVDYVVNKSSLPLCIDDIDLLTSQSFMTRAIHTIIFQRDSCEKLPASPQCTGIID